jgi:hypothetical protein
MKIEYQTIEEMTISEFADKHGLKMIVKERKLPDGHSERFYAFFDCAEVKEWIVLRSEYGNGSIPEDAILNYAREISLKKLVINAMSPDKRKEIEVPRLSTQHIDRIDK